MWQRFTCFVCVVVLLALIPGGAALGAWNFLEDDALIGWWACDEGEGAAVADSSANGNDGAFVYGDPAWTTGAYGNAVTLVGPTLVEIQPMNLTLTEATMAGWLLPNGTQTDWASIMMHRFGDPAIAHGFNLVGGGLAYHWNDSSMTWSFRPAGTYSDTEWTFCALTVAPDKATFYINGEAKDENVIAHDPAVWEGAVYLGGDGTDAWVSRRMNGSLDDVSFFSRALSLDEIVAIMGGPGAAGLAAWEDAAMAAAPAFFATDVVDGIYDIGALSGDITYEFIVQSNPLEEQASMALIGRRNFGDTQVGLKYEQWNNTGTYGATVFGVADYDYGVATNPGVITHLAFVSSEDTATTALYVDGVLQGSIDSAITLSGLVGIGYGAQAEDGSDFFDDFDGAIFGVAIYDAALSSGQIRVNADTYLQNGPSDITAAGDMVQGVPNDGDWPGGETPDLAVDDDAATKYLHFKGATEPTGIQVTPMLGATMVTGLTLTTANDAVERDPISFELYGSNESIDGPYELIAAGAVADFNDVNDAWPRFTMNATAITFENAVAYEHYQIMFPAVRDPASANSMQVAEVELIGVPCLPRYTYEGDDLDDQWNHDNGSDAWDGTSPGEGSPGGAGAMVEDGVTFLRIQDTGDPRDYDMPDPSNRKVYLTHSICASLDGAHLEVGVRVATGAGLDDLHPDGGAGISPWPEAGIGYHIRDNGKGMIGISDGSQVISFSLAKAGEIADLETDALVMNNLVGTEPSGDVDTGDAGVANVLAIADATAWNNIVIDIVAGGAGTHVATVSVNGDPAQSFDVTAGTGAEGDYSCITVGSSGTGAVTAFDVDYLSVTN
jgi:concanavalin A-like lectin/glucanase superfamily protein